MDTWLVACLQARLEQKYIKKNFVHLNGWTLFTSLYKADFYILSFQLKWSVPNINLRDLYFQKFWHLKNFRLLKYNPPLMSYDLNLKKIFEKIIDL